MTDPDSGQPPSSTGPSAAGRRWDEIKAIFAHLRAELGAPLLYVAILVAGAFGFRYLFPFWWGADPRWRVEDPKPSARPEELGRDARLDLYVASDVSGSIDRARYDEVERELDIRSHLRGGDKLHCFRFGSFALASGCLQPVPGTASNDPPGMSGMTRFDALFNQLIESIEADRTTPHHAIVLIFSDGVPDSEGHGLLCPDQFRLANKVFIDEEIRSSFYQLITGSALEGQVLPFLVLSGSDSHCVEAIRNQWQSALPELTVIAYSDLGRPGEIWDIVLDKVTQKTSINRTPCLYVWPAQERLDQGRRGDFMGKRQFSARFQFSSTFAAAEATVKNAKLLDSTGTELAELLVLNESSQSASEPDSRVVLSTKAPAPGKVHGPVLSKELWFRFDSANPRSPQLVEDEPGYVVRLELDGPRASARLSDLVIGPKVENPMRAVFLARQHQLLIVLIVLAALYVAFLASLRILHWMPRRLQRVIQLASQIPGESVVLGLSVLAALVTFTWMCLIHPLSIFIQPVLGAVATHVIKAKASHPGRSAGGTPPAHGLGHATTWNPGMLFFELALLPTLEVIVLMFGSTMDGLLRL